MDIQPYFDHTDQLFELYRDLKLEALDDIQEWNGTTTINHFSNVTRSRENIHPFPESDFKIYDEFVALSGDIKFCAGMLHYLFPHTSHIPSHYDSTIIDRRYAMHVNFGYQSVYHLWDRIGDLLWIYFPTNIPKEQVFTAKVLKQITQPYRASQPFIDLVKLFHASNPAINERHKIVHNFSIGIEISWQRIHSYGNHKKLEKLQKKLQWYRDHITEALPASIKAIELSLLLIQELPVKYPQK
jgi:hypothetical protein